MNRVSLSRFAWLSIAAAVITILLKAVAYWLTGSVGLLSDALESFVNLVGAIMAAAMLYVAARPPDEEHSYGHSKAEYFSSGVEGTLIVLAACSIAWAALPRLLTPRPIEQVGLGLFVSIIASLVNFVVARILLRAGQQHDSIALEANARHLMTDVWTSAGVIVAVGLVAVTDWEILDPLIALVVAANIVRSGFGLVRRSIFGLMDAALSPEEQATVRNVLERYQQEKVQFHAVRTRQAGARRFVSMHVLVPGTWSVRRGHRLLEQIDSDIRRELPHTTVFTHLEPLDDAASWHDVSLDRSESMPEPSTQQR